MFTKQSFINTELAKRFFGSSVSNMKTNQLKAFNGFLLQKVGDGLFIMQEMR